MSGTLIITRGLPGSGKTAFAKAWVNYAQNERTRVNRVDLREMLFGQTAGLSFEQESLVTKAQREVVKAHLKAGMDVIADDMNLRLKHVNSWHRFARHYGFGFRIEEFPISIEASKQRQLGRTPRGERVPNDAIDKMRRFLDKDGQLLPFDGPDLHPLVMKPYMPDESRPKAVIVDIDGTVAHMTGRDPYDLSKVHTDVRNEDVCQMVERLFSCGRRIIFLSGRSEASREATDEWLSNNINVDHDGLVMRHADDFRDDSIVKYELFNEHVRDHYNVVGVFDDRNSVVDMWRSIGLTCFQVAEGDF